MLLRPFSSRHLSEDETNEEGVLRFKRDIHILDPVPAGEGQVVASVVQNNLVLARGVPGTIKNIVFNDVHHTLAKFTYCYEASMKMLPNKIYDIANATLVLKLIIVFGVSDAQRQYTPSIEDGVQYLVSMFKPDSQGGYLLSSLYSQQFDKSHAFAKKDPSGMYHRILMLDVCDPRYHIVKTIDKDKGDRFRSARNIPIVYQGRDLLTRVNTQIHQHMDGVTNPKTSEEIAREYHEASGSLLPLTQFEHTLDRKLALENLMVGLTRYALSLITSNCILVYDTERGKFSFTVLEVPIKGILEFNGNTLGALQLDFIKQCEKLSEKFDCDLYVVMSIKDTEHRIRCIFKDGSGPNHDGTIITVRLPKYDCVNEFMFDRHNIDDRSVQTFANRHELRMEDLDFYTTMGGGAPSDGLTRYFK
jgi:hypothetical protein